MVSAHTRPVISLAAMAAQVTVSPARGAGVDTVAHRDGVEQVVNTGPEPSGRSRGS
ncbi:MAG: hypothetical protein WB783_08530 [Arenicellales bacterium]